MRRLEILGVPVHAVTEKEAVEWVATSLTDNAPRRIVTINPEFVMEARRNRPFAAVLRSADLCLPDGAGLRWAARRLGDRLPARVAGVDFVRAIAARGAICGWRFFLLGARPGIAEAAAAALQADYPGLQVVGTFSGSPRLEDDRLTTEAVSTTRPDILLVAYGAPAQEIWIARNLERSGARIAIGVGGALDFLSGSARRAPLWMQERGLEWLHRLAQQPWRWRRMLALPHFVARVLAEEMP